MSTGVRFSGQGQGDSAGWAWEYARSNTLVDGKQTPVFHPLPDTLLIVDVEPEIKGKNPSLPWPLLANGVCRSFPPNIDGHGELSPSASRLVFLFMAISL